MRHVLSNLISCLDSKYSLLRYFNFSPVDVSLVMIKKIKKLNNRIKIMLSPQIRPNMAQITQAAIFLIKGSLNWR